MFPCPFLMFVCTAKGVIVPIVMLITNYLCTHINKGIVITINNIIFVLYVIHNTYTYQRTDTYIV